MERMIARPPNDASGVVLVVEDNPADIFLIQEAIKVHEVGVRLEIVEDGEQAEQWIAAKKEPPPVGVILDLNLPRRSGADILAIIRASPHMKETPVIVFTSSGSQRDRSLEDRYPRTLYLRKSADLDEFMQIGSLLKELIAGQADSPA